MHECDWIPTSDKDRWPRFGERVLLLLESREWLRGYVDSEHFWHDNFGNVIAPPPTHFTFIALPPEPEQSADKFARPWEKSADLWIKSCITGREVAKCETDEERTLIIQCVNRCYEDDCAAAAVTVDEILDGPSQPTDETDEAAARIRKMGESHEKRARIYYQDIVYKVCGLIDDYQGWHVSRGEGTVCGTVRDSIEAIFRTAKQWREQLDAEREWSRRLFKAARGLRGLVRDKALTFTAKNTWERADEMIREYEQWAIRWRLRQGGYDGTGQIRQYDIGQCCEGSTGDRQGEGRRRGE